ncbi:MAG: SsrA-binding protein SmpB [Leadbetterella sp.]
MAFQKQIDIQNRKAKFEFALLDVYTAGIVLTGTEIKSVREGKVNLSDSYGLIDNGEIILKNLHISIYENGTYNNHQPLRDRKLLLTKKEIKKINGKLVDKGLTFIPTRFFINEKGLAKVEIAIAKGKKLYDKRESIKEKDVQRDIDRRG